MDDADEIMPPQEIEFCTLGMFIIDEIHYSPPTPPVFNILGGAGAYSALGARLFSPPPLSHTVSWVVDKGSDFPPSIADTIQAWKTSCVIREDPSRLTTRGWNCYDENQNRAFKYTTTKLRLDEESLTNNLLFSKSFHLCCSAIRCKNLVQSILSKRRAIKPDAERPLFIWEPVPDLCKPDELLNCTNTLPYIDVLSPNHNDLAGFMGDPDRGHDPITGDISVVSVERACEQLLNSMPLQSYTLVIRCGPKGCYVAKMSGQSRAVKKQKKRPANHGHGGLTMDMDMESLFAGLNFVDGMVEFDRPAIDAGLGQWLPPFFTPDQKDRVVDPTGGGNGFLGGLAIGLARGKGILEAAAWGTISASFCIEQVGVPELAATADGQETWNGEVLEARLQSYLSRPETAGIGIVERPAIAPQDSDKMGFSA